MVSAGFLAQASHFRSQSIKAIYLTPRPQTSHVAHARPFPRRCMSYGTGSQLVGLSVSLGRKLTISAAASSCGGDLEDYDRPYVEELKHFQDKYGHNDVPSEYSSSLAFWISCVRAAGPNDRRVKALAAAGVKLCFGNERREERFQQMKKHFKERGHFYPRFGEPHTPAGLYTWMGQVRAKLRKKKNAAWVRRLQSIGFPFDPTAARNEGVVVELERIAAEKGGGALLKRWKPEDPKIVCWLNSMARLEETLTAEQLERLRKLGWKRPGEEDEIILVEPSAGKQVDRATSAGFGDFVFPFAMATLLIFFFY
jgi:hypothetical protein